MQLSDLSANTATNANASDRLYKLIEYIARGLLSINCLEILANGEVKLALKTSWTNGTTLVVLIPPPRSHLACWAEHLPPIHRSDATSHSDPRSKKDSSLTVTLRKQRNQVSSKTISGLRCWPRCLRSTSPPRAQPRHKQGEFHFEPDEWSSEHLS